MKNATAAAALGRPAGGSRGHPVSCRVTRWLGLLSKTLRQSIRHRRFLHLLDLCATVRPRGPENGLFPERFKSGAEAEFALAIDRGALAIAPRLDRGCVALGTHEHLAELRRFLAPIEAVGNRQRRIGAHLLYNREPLLLMHGVACDEIAQHILHAGIARGVVKPNRQRPAGG